MEKWRDQQAGVVPEPQDAGDEDAGVIIDRPARAAARTSVRVEHLAARLPQLTRAMRSTRAASMYQRVYPKQTGTPGQQERFRTRQLLSSDTRGSEPMSQSDTPKPNGDPKPIGDPSSTLEEPEGDPPSIPEEPEGDPSSTLEEPEGDPPSAPEEPEGDPPSTLEGDDQPI